MNAEIQQAYDAANSVLYEAWIGCLGIGFSRSLDGGATFQPAFSLPVSTTPDFSWDPAIALAPNGTVYVSYMVHTSGPSITSNDSPVVAWSYDHGVTFSGFAFVSPPSSTVFGDRDFLAVAPNGTVYVTWNEAPVNSEVQIACAPGGSCYYSAGDFNIVLSSSSDGGRTWAVPTPVSPDWPNGGALAAPLLVEPNGTIDLVYEDYNITDPTLHTLGWGYDYFVRSTDGGRTWSSRVLLSPSPSPNTEWWINGALSRDDGGTLYAGFTTETLSGADQPQLAFSSNDGASWTLLDVGAPVAPPYATIMVTPAGGPSGEALVGWMTNDTLTGGWSTYVQTFVVGTERFSSPELVSDRLGWPGYWVGDTIGVTYLGNTSWAVSWTYGTYWGEYQGKQVVLPEVFEAPVSTPLSTLYSVVIQESGLFGGVGSAYPLWSVELNGHLRRSFASNPVSFSVANGSYSFYPIAPCYRVAPLNLTVNGSSIAASVTFAPSACRSLDLVEVGLPAGVTWSATVSWWFWSNVSASGVVPSSGSSMLGFGSLNGTVSFRIQAPSGYGVARVTGPALTSFSAVTVNAASTSATKVVVHFGALQPVSFAETRTSSWPGLPNGSTWNVTLFPTQRGEDPSVLSASTNGSSVGWSLPRGTHYRFLVTKSPEYRAAPFHGALGVGGKPVVKPVKFRPFTGTIKFKDASHTLGTSWYVNLTGPWNLSLSGATAKLRAKLINGTYGYAAQVRGGPVVTGTFTVVAPLGQVIELSLTAPVPKRSGPSLGGLGNDVALTACYTTLGPRTVARLDP